jgi:hypothetical protein
LVEEYGLVRNDEQKKVRRHKKGRKGCAIYLNVGLLDDGKRSEKRFE